MLLVAFDTSTPAVTVAVVSDVDAPYQPAAVGRPREPSTRILAQRAEIANNRHGELLASSIRNVLDEAGLSPRDLGAVGVGLGPGPFTGLRVGIMTAKAMGDALGIPTHGVCSLDVVAAGHRIAAGGLAVLTDARRKQVYWAVYDEQGRRVEGPEIGHPTELAAALRGRVTNLAGAGAVLYRDVFADFTVCDHDQYPQAGLLGSMVAEQRWLQPTGSDLAPMYLRRPDARPPGAPKKVTPA